MALRRTDFVRLRRAGQRPEAAGPDHPLGLRRRDPTGAYAATLDKFDRPTVLNDPADATDFTTAYRADGQLASQVQPNGNTTASAYDKLGHLLTKNTTAAGPTNRALYTWTYNRAGQILTEASTVTGDPANGTITYAYDPLARLTGSTLSATTTTYAWDAVPNRTSVKIGAGTATTTTFNAANRPTSGANPTAAYTSDDDGRLTARPNQTMTWDDLGRLTAVKNAAGTITLAAYTYDPLDRLRMVDYGAGVRTRFRYVGTTTSAAQLIDDAAGTVTRNIGNDWTGERVLDWTGTNSNIRIYGTNAHHDVTWLASSTGSVSQALRYDPWGNPRSTVPTGYTPFRFQGSFYDAATDLSWVVTRWYAPTLGTFISEDGLLGQPREPDSRHLYAYGEGQAIGAWDPDGRASQVGGGGGMVLIRDTKVDRTAIFTAGLTAQWNLSCFMIGATGALSLGIGFVVGAACLGGAYALDYTWSRFEVHEMARTRVWGSRYAPFSVREELQFGIKKTHQHDRYGNDLPDEVFWTRYPYWRHTYRFENKKAYLACERLADFRPPMYCIYFGKGSNGVTQSWRSERWSDQNSSGTRRVNYGPKWPLYWDIL